MTLIRRALLFGLAALLLLGGHAAIEFVARTSSNAAATADAHQKAIFLIASFERTAEAVEAMLDDTVMRLAGITDPREAQLILQNKPSPEAVVQLAAIAPDGWLLTSSLPMSGPVDLSDREHFRVHRDAQAGSSELFISAPLIGRVSGEWTIQFAKARRGPAGEFAGVVVASYATEALVDLYSRFPMEEGFLIALTGLDGVVRARSVKGSENLFGIAAPVRDLHDAVVRGGSRPAEFTSPIDGIFRVGWAEVSDRHPLYVLVASPLFAAWPYHASWLLLAAGLAGFGIMARQRLENAVLQERLETAQRTAEVTRLVSLGELAAGLGHEVATPANTILLAAQNLLRAIDRDGAAPEVVKAKLARITANAERIKALMEAVRGNARQSSGRGACEPAHAVENALLLVGSQLQLAGIEIRTRIHSCGSVACASTDLETVLINLLLNARDAVRANTSDRKVVKISCAPFGNEARIVVEDSGGGVPAEIRRKIFQPFFTTKPVGKGTGIGLSTALGIVTAAQGTLELENASEGARFTVRLPLQPGAAEPVTGAAPPNNRDLENHSSMAPENREDEAGTTQIASDLTPSSGAGGAARPETP